MPAPGSRVEHYTILARLGSGAMGEVFRARDEDLGRDIALKFLAEDKTKDAAAVERFLREARATSSLNHPNIVTIHEIGESGAQRYLAMELVEGRTLRSMIGQRPTPAELKRVGRQLAEALRAAHAEGIAHRDIKPENVMVRPDGYVKLLDFGLARLASPDEGISALQLSQVTAHGVVIGSARYMSPEQARGETLGTATDIFSLGLILFEWATGRHPFASDFPMEVIRAIMSDDPPPLRRWRPDLPDECEALLRQMLNRDPAARPTAGAVENELDRIGELTRDPAKSAASKTGAIAASRVGTSSAVAVQVKMAPDDRALASVAGNSGGASETTSPIAMPEPAARPPRRLPRLAWAFAAVGLVAAAAAAWWAYHAGRAPIDSIAVLPLAHPAEDGSEMLADGLTESVIDTLSQLPQLRVLARSTVFRFKNAASEPQKIGRDLGVQAILTGQLTSSSNRIRVNVELVKVTDGTRLWGAEFERPALELLTIRQEIARGIAERLKLRLGSDQVRQLAHADTENREAYRLYWEGRFHWNQRTDAGLKRAAERFEEAIRLDPSYALAYVGLAETIGLQGLHGTNDAPRIRSLAEKAMQLDPSRGEPHVALGMLSFTEWDWRQSESEFQKAVELSPNYATGWHWYSLLLRTVGRMDEGRRAIQRAYDLDPMSPIIQLNLVLDALDRGDFADARTRADRLDLLAPEHQVTAVARFALAMCEGRAADAVPILEKSPDATAHPEELRLSLGVVWAKLGRRQEALEVARELESPPNGKPPMYSAAAAVYGALGDWDQAFTLLDQAVLRREYSLLEMNFLPLAADLRKQPRFADLRRRMGLPPLPAGPGTDVNRVIQ